MVRNAAALIVALLLAACSSPDDDVGIPEEPGTGTPVDVTLTSFEIEMPGEVPAGTITFAVTNDSEHDHGFAIEGGVDRSLIPQIAPGDEDTVTIDLEAGTYIVFCPIGDHRDQGMEAELVVTEGGGS